MSFHAKCTQRLGTFYLQELCKDNKTKGKSTMILHVQLIVSYCKLPCVCTCACACDCTYLREHCGNMHYDRTLLEGSYYLLLLIFYKNQENFDEFSYVLMFWRFLPLDVLILFLHFIKHPYLQILLVYFNITLWEFKVICPNGTSVNIAKDDWMVFRSFFYE